MSLDCRCHMGNMKECIKRPKILLVPYPAQGHVTPMLKLASSILIHTSFQPLIVIPDFIHRRIAPPRGPKDEDRDDVLFVSIPDGLDDGEEPAARDFFSIETAMECNMPGHFEKLVLKLKENEDDDDNGGGGGGVACIIVDLLASWAIKVADQCGVPVAGFWPAMLATYNLMTAIPNMVLKGLISDSGIPKQEGTLCFVPGQPPLNIEELPWLIGTLAARKSRFKFWTTTLNRSKSLRWLLVNSFPEESTNKNGCFKKLEISKVDDILHNDPLVIPIGPLSKHTSSVENKNPSFWEEDMSCLDWLDTQNPNSVVYISFGSWVSPIGVEKIKDLALSLEASGRPFIWVLGTAWREGLPVGYLERLLLLPKKDGSGGGGCGKVVSWAPQVEVLKHKAVGCYLTHCGWNSTMEAIDCKKRLLCYPVASDQFVNCNYIVNVWKIGVKINGFGQKDVEEGLRRVMEDGEMSDRLMRLNEKTMGDEACSRVMGNLTTFLDSLI